MQQSIHLKWKCMQYDIYEMRLNMNSFTVRQCCAPVLYASRFPSGEEWAGLPLHGGSDGPVPSAPVCPDLLVFVPEPAALFAGLGGFGELWSFCKPRPITKARLVSFSHAGLRWAAPVLNLTNTENRLFLGLIFIWQNLNFKVLRGAKTLSRVWFLFLQHPGCGVCCRGWLCGCWAGWELCGAVSECCTCGSQSHHFTRPNLCLSGGTASKQTCTSTGWVQNKLGTPL